MHACVFVHGNNSLQPCSQMCDASNWPHLEAWVGDEPGVVAQVGGVVLHHALRLRLAEVLVGGGEATGRQHHSGGFWEKRQERRGRGSERASLHKNLDVFHRSV